MLLIIGFILLFIFILFGIFELSFDFKNPNNIFIWYYRIYWDKEFKQFAKQRKYKIIRKIKNDKRTNI